MRPTGNVAATEPHGYPEITRLTATNNVGHAIRFFVVDGRVAYMKVGLNEPSWNGTLVLIDTAPLIVWECHLGEHHSPMTTVR